MKIRTRNNIVGYCFMTPWIIGFFVFVLWPVLYSMYLSLCDVKLGVQGIQTIFMGIENYIAAFRQDTYFSTALTGSISYISLSTPLIIVFALAIALLLNNKFKGRTFFRAIYFLPVIIISGPVMAELITNKASNVLGTNFSIIYKIFAEVPLLGKPVTYAFENIVMILWFSGVQVLIFLAGLQKIDNSLYEVAKIDGASSWEMFWKITIVNIKPLILVSCIYTILELATFPNQGINRHILNNMFSIDKVYAYSAAMAWIYFVAMLILIGIAVLILGERGEKRGRYDKRQYK